MKSTRTEKHLAIAVKKAKEILRPKRVTIVKADKVNTKMPGFIKRDFENNFVLTANRDFKTSAFFSDKEIRSALAKSGKNEFIIGRHYIGHRSAKQCKIFIDEFKSVNFSDRKKKYQRLIIEVKRKIDFRYIFKIKYVSTEHAEAIQVNMGKYDFDIMIYKDDKERTYLILDCKQKIGYLEFSDYAFACLVALGYMTGSFVQDEGVYLSYPGQDFSLPDSYRYTGLRKSTYSIHHPLNQNPYGFNANSRQKDKIYEKIKPFTEEQFSNLCMLAYQRHDFRVILLLMIETVVGPIFLYATGMAVALEAITNLYKEQNPDRYKSTVREDRLSTTTLDALREIINDSVPDPNSARRYLDAINNFNQPSTLAKLSTPFKLAGFDLNETDKEVINRRNDLMHGRLTLGMQDDEKSSRETYLVATKLYTLVNILILKLTGYSGYITNWPVHNRHVHKRKLKEEIFRYI